jgi:hypothetical protein
MNRRNLLALAVLFALTEGFQKMALENISITGDARNLVDGWANCYTYSLNFRQTLFPSGCGTRC